MTPWNLKAFLFVSSLAAVGCAGAPAPPVAYGYVRSDARAEAQALEAARRHPNAQPRVRSEYPEQQPPPLPQGTSLPAPAYVTRRTQPSLAVPTIVEPVWDHHRRYDYAPRYGSAYGYDYGYYSPSYAYPRYGFGLNLGWRSGYGWSSWGRPYYGYGVYHDPWIGHRHFGGHYDRPHRHFSHHHHGGGFRHALDTPRLSAPRGFSGWHGGGRQRLDVRVRR